MSQYFIIYVIVKDSLQIQIRLTLDNGYLSTVDWRDSDWYADD